MNRNIAKHCVAAILSPIPIVALLACFALWVWVQPVDMIDGRPDNSPRWAAEALLGFLLPFMIYPTLVLIVVLQTAVVRRFSGFQLRSHLIAGALTSILMSAGMAGLMYAPHLGESYILMWAMLMVPWSVLMLVVVPVWWIIMTKVPTTAFTGRLRRP